MFIDIIHLLRVKQWYKNLLVFLPLLFSGNLFSLELLLITILAFFAFCFVSSANYVINDVVDVEKDRVHPEKKLRPLASRRISHGTALGIIGVLLALSALISLLLPFIFGMLLLLFFALTQLYTFYFKNILFADLLFIGINFVIRSISGAFVVVKSGIYPYVEISPWIILAPFFLALLLSVSKREADYKLMGISSKSHKKTLENYTPEITASLMNILTASLLIVYAIYSVFSYNFSLLISLPFAIFCLFRWFYLVKSGSIITRHPELIYKDTHMLMGVILWVISVIIGIYFL